MSKNRNRQNQHQNNNDGMMGVPTYQFPQPGEYSKDLDYRDDDYENQEENDQD